MGLKAKHTSYFNSGVNAWPTQPLRGCGPEPKVAVLSNLGNGSDAPCNPNGVAAGLYVESGVNSIIDDDSRRTDLIGYAGRLGHNPGGVGELAAVFPRVAEYSNPGLEDGAPSGNMSKLQSTQA